MLLLRPYRLFDHIDCLTIDMKTVHLFGREFGWRRDHWFGLRWAQVAGGRAMGQLPRHCKSVSASERAGLLALTRGFLTLASDIDMLEEFAYLRTQEGGKIHLELLPNQGMLIK